VGLCPAPHTVTHVIPLLPSIRCLNVRPLPTGWYLLRGTLFLPGSYACFCLTRTGLRISDYGIQSPGTFHPTTPRQRVDFGVNCPLSVDDSSILDLCFTWSRVSKTRHLPKSRIRPQHDNVLVFSSRMRLRPSPQGDFPSPLSWFFSPCFIVVSYMRLP